MRHVYNSEMQTVVLMQLENHRFKWNHSRGPDIRGSVCYTSEKTSHPHWARDNRGSSISEAEGDANNSIKVFHCPHKVSL